MNDDNIGATFDNEFDKTQVFLAVVPPTGQDIGKCGDRS